MAKATYIYGEREWVLTGREARKKSSREGARTKEMVEIRPASVVDVEDTSHNKWVKMEDLYHVVGSADDDE